MNDDCNLKYPLLMVHGIAFRDWKHLCYWGRIPETLESHGAKIYFGKQDAIGSVEWNADLIAKSLDEILEETGAEKVNILAHSKGGLESRYLANHGYADKIASITTIDTPHHGLHFVDRLMECPQWVIDSVGYATNIYGKVLGDENPDALSCFDTFTTKTAEKFNKENPIPEGIYCQSYAFKCESAFSDSLFCITYPFVRKYDGENDGMVSVESATWANFRGVLTSPARRGVSHGDVIDIRRHRITPYSPNSANQVNDILVFYIGIIDELRQMGY